jgi:hypothetical protein
MSGIGSSPIARLSSAGIGSDGRECAMSLKVSKGDFVASIGGREDKNDKLSE